MSDAKEVLTIPEVAAVLRMHFDTAYRQIKAGTFPVRVIQIGSRYKVLRVDLERFLAGTATAPTAASDPGAEALAMKAEALAMKARVAELLRKRPRDAATQAELDDIDAKADELLRRLR